ncbi:MAG: DegV family protein [Dehalococcoidales bacterium]|nr:DegV family protein [Dehalococcoidales bacterium]
MPENRVAVIADSIACIPRDLLAQYRIGVISLNFYVNGNVYRDGIDVTPSEAYELFLKDPETFKTSGASPGVCLDAYRHAARQGKDIFSVILSSKLSAIYSTAATASQQIQAEFPGISVVVLDSMTAAAAEGLIALAAARAAETGKSLAEVTAVADKVRDNVKIIAYMDTVRYIYRSGRIPKIASVAGSMLKIKPIFTFTSGVPRFMGAVRSKKIGIERLFEEMREKVGNKPVHVAVMHVYAEDDAIQLKKRVTDEFNCAELWLTEFSPLMGYACGTGTLGLAFYPEE